MIVGGQTEARAQLSSTALREILFGLQKICQSEAISSANDFLHPPKFLQALRNFKDSVD